MQVFSAEPLTGNDQNGVYALLNHLGPRVCVDVGAAAGDTARLMLNAKPSRLYAIEPFPGNWQFLERQVTAHKNAQSGLSRVEILKAAAAAAAGKRNMICTSQVVGQEKGWEDRVGYSSVSRFPRNNEAGNLEVDCIVIDDTIPEPISFLKIDVQGAEREVLDGCERHFNGEHVDLCYVEYAGEVDLLPFFEKFGFTVYYTPTLVVSREGGVTQNIEGARRVSSKPLSTGSVGEIFWADATPTESADLPAYYKTLRKHCQYAQTDLICVAPHFQQAFHAAAADLARTRYVQ